MAGEALAGAVGRPTIQQFAGPPGIERLKRRDYHVQFFSEAIELPSLPDRHRADRWRAASLTS